VNKNDPVSQKREVGFLFWNIRRNLKNAAIADFGNVSAGIQERLFPVANIHLDSGIKKKSPTSLLSKPHFPASVSV